MGEWSDYFEDFPEENSENYVGKRFDPQRAKALREAEAKAKARIAADQGKLDAEIADIVKKHSKPSSPSTSRK